MSSTIAKDIDDFISRYPVDIQKLLRQMRDTIHKASPDLEEAIAYGIPTFRLNKKNVVHFSGYGHHIGFYPGAAGIEKFLKELKSYKTSKGAVQFPTDKPLPLELVTRIAQYRVLEERKRTLLKSLPLKKSGTTSDAHGKVSKKSQLKSNRNKAK